MAVKSSKTRKTASPVGARTPTKTQPGAPGKAARPAPKPAPAKPTAKSAARPVAKNVAKPPATRAPAAKAAPRQAARSTGVVYASALREMIAKRLGRA